MIKKLFFIIVGILGIFLALVLISNWYFNKLSDLLSKIQIPAFEESKLEVPKNFETGITNEITEKEFISSDGKLKLKYPSDFTEIEDKNTLERMVSEENEKKYNLKILLFAQNFNFKEKKYEQLIVSEFNVEESKNFDNIIEIMKETNKKAGWEMEILKSEIKNNELIFEAKYQKEGKKTFRSKEKIISLPEKEGKEKVFSIAVISLEENWIDFQKKAEEIINSTQLVE